MEFAKTTPAPKVKTKNIRMISTLTAVLFVIIVVAQLFTFEKFAEVLQVYYGALLDGGIAMILAASIVTLEVAALPFLLMMPLSPAARMTSMVAGWLVVGIWCVLSVVSLVNNGEYTALLGATIDLPSGGWTVLFCIALGVLIAWTSWGMWPLTPRRRSK